MLFSYDSDLYAPDSLRPHGADFSGWREKMIAYIRGELVLVNPDRIVVEAGGIGYTVNIPLSVAEELPHTGQEVKIYTYFQVREDAMQLYGFLRQDDLDVFRLLLGVNGVGPKAAMGVLSTLSADDLRFAVLSGDEKAIAKAPGLGKKTAQKIILELKDKLNLEDAFEQKSAHAAAAVRPGEGNLSEAAQALTALGYSASEALHAVRNIEGAGEMEVEELIRQALKTITF